MAPATPDRFRPGFKMSKYLWLAVATLALVFGLHLVFHLAAEYAGVCAGAEYEPGVGFSGVSHFGKATYNAVRWYPNPQDPEPCPLRIHLPDGDLGAAELASPDTLLARGWKELVQDEAMTPELAEALRSLPVVRDDNPPRVLQRWHGALLLSVTFGEGGLRAVWVGRGPLERQEGILSVAGKRLSLPITDAEADRILGEPLGRRQGWVWWW
jgi:hypothetical protein